MLRNAAAAPDWFQPVTADAYPLPFRHLDLGEKALKEFFGYQLEGFADASLLEPEKIPLMRFKRRKRPFWKFW